MMNKKMIAIVASAAFAACLGLAACSAPASSGSAASASASASSAASASAASESAASASAAAESASAAASSAAAESASAAASSAAAESASAAAPSASAAAPSYIGDQAAIDIALKDAGFAQGDVIELEVELDLDDAVIHYDVNFKNGGMEYDYDIDAVSGAIIQAKSEVDD